MENIIGSIQAYKTTYPLHQHDAYEVVVYHGGTGVLCVGEKKIAVLEGSVVVVPPGIPHQTVPQSAGLKSIYIRGEFGNLFRFDEPVFLKDERQEGLRLAQMILDNRYSAPDYCDALCHAFAYYVLKNVTVNDPILYAVDGVVREITERFYDSNINPRVLLNESGYAEDYLRTQFKRIMGKTPTAFLNEVRIRHACHLMDVYKGSVSLLEIALQCGYTDYVYFSKRFKQETGESPQQYKNGYKKVRITRTFFLSIIGSRGSGPAAG